MKALFSVLMVTFLMAVSCQTEKTDDTSHGYGTLGVIISGEQSFDVILKSQEQSPIQLDTYKVSVFDESDNLLYGPVEYGDFESQILPLGTYYVIAESCTTTEAEIGNGQMRLWGRSADIVLSLSSMSQTAAVDCTVANAKVAVAFDPSVSGIFEDLSVTITGGTTPNRKIVVNETPSDQETELWFNPSDITYSISGIFKPTGKQLVLEATRSLSAKDNIQLMVKVNLDNGEITTNPTINVDVTLNEQDEYAEFNPYEN